MSKATKEMLKKIISTQELIMKHLKIESPVATKSEPKKTAGKQTVKRAAPKKSAAKKR